MKKTRARQIEIEFRSIFDKKKYDELKAFLDKKAEDLGKDDKDIYFFLLPDKVFKVVNNISKKTAKIVLKLNRVGRGRSDFEEIEIFIDPDDFQKAVEIFSSLGFKEIQHSFQKRHNYLYREVELALKYSRQWSYHLELEVIVNHEKDKTEAEKKIREVARDLGVKLMSNTELARFAKKIDENYKKGIYNEDK